MTNLGLKKFLIINEILDLNLVFLTFKHFTNSHLIYLAALTKL